MKPRQKEEADPQSFLPLKPAVFHILLSLSDQELHGYGIMKAVEEATDGGVRLHPSPLYRRLKRLLEQGVVKESEGPADSELDDERRRYYGLTALGRKVLAEEAARVMALSRSDAIRALAAEVK